MIFVYIDRPISPFEGGWGDVYIKGGDVYIEKTLINSAF